MKLFLIAVFVFVGYAVQSGSSAPLSKQLKDLEFLRDILKDEIARRQLLNAGGSSGTANGNGQGQQGGGAQGPSGASGDGPSGSSGEGPSGSSGEGPSGWSGEGPSGTSGEGPSGMNPGESESEETKELEEVELERRLGSHQSGDGKKGGKHGHDKHSGEKQNEGENSGQQSGDGEKLKDADKASELEGNERARQLLVDLETSVHDVLNEEVDEIIAHITEEDVKGARAVLDNAMIVLDELPKVIGKIVKHFRDEIRPLDADVEAAEDELKKALESAGETPGASGSG